MAIHRFIRNWNNSKVGVVSIHLSIGSWLEVETIPVEAGVWGARLDGVVEGFGDIPYCKGVDILKGNSWQGLGLDWSDRFGWREELGSMVPYGEQLWVEKAPLLLGVTSL